MLKTKISKNVFVSCVFGSSILFWGLDSVLSIKNLIFLGVKEASKPGIVFENTFFSKEEDWENLIN